MGLRLIFRPLGRPKRLARTQPQCPRAVGNQIRRAQNLSSVARPLLNAVALTDKAIGLHVRAGTENVTRSPNGASNVVVG